MYKSLFVLIFSIFLSLPIIAQNDIELNKETIDSIPQGKFKYEIYFAEWGGRMANTSCDVLISGNKIKVLRNEKTGISGDDKILLEGFLLKHESGRWIIAEQYSDIKASEIGGCSGGPIPIDLEKMIIELC